MPVMEDKEQRVIEEFYKSNDIKYYLPPAVYHYTSAVSMVSIIENNSLWFSDRRFMSDMMDSSYGKEKIRAKFSNEFNQTPWASRLSTPHYVFSTTIAKDSFFHYSCYGNYCVEFDTAKLVSYIKNCITRFGPHEGMAPPFTYSNVIYDELTVDKVSNIISDNYEKSIEKELNTPFCSFYETGKWTDIYIHFLAILKQKGFASEQEFRFLIESNYNKRYRLNKFESIPYLCLTLSEAKLPIKRVTIGKLANSKEVQCVEDVLKKRNIDVLHSDLKIRADYDAGGNLIYGKNK